MVDIASYAVLTFEHEQDLHNAKIQKGLSYEQIAEAIGRYDSSTHVSGTHGDILRAAPMFGSLRSCSAKRSRSQRISTS